MKKIIKRISVTLVLFLVLLFITYCGKGAGRKEIVDYGQNNGTAADNGEKFPTSSIKIADLPAKYKDEFHKLDNKFYFSPDGSKFAYLVTELQKEGETNFVVVNGQEGKKYPYPSQIGHLGFTSDGKLYYKVKRFSYDKKIQIVVIDGREGKPFENINIYTSKPSVLGEDSSTIYYEALEDKNISIVLDDKQSKSYKSINTPIISPDGKHLAFVANKYPAVVVRDTIDGNQYYEIDELQFSPDSQRLAYIAKKNVSNATQLIVYDVLPDSPAKLAGLQPGDQFIEIKNNNQFDEFNKQTTGKKTIYNIFRNGKKLEVMMPPSNNSLSDKGELGVLTIEDRNPAYKWIAVVDAKESKAYDKTDSISFSRDSRHIAFIAKDSRGEFVVLDGKEMKNYDEVSYPYFADNNETLIYSAKRNNQWLIVDGDNEFQVSNNPMFLWKKKGKIGYVLNENKKSSVVINNVPEKVYERVGIVYDIFSPDDNNYAYSANNENNYFIVFNGKELYSYTLSDKDDYVSAVQFSPDSQKIVYIIRDKGKSKVVVNGKSNNEYDMIYTSPKFSPDSSKVEYGAKLGDEFWWIVDNVGS